MNKITFINRFYYPDISATSQLLTDLSVSLVRQGHDVTVVTSNKLFNDNKKMLSSKETFKGVNIVRLKSTSFARFGLAGKAVDYLSFYFSATTSLLWRAGSNDILVAKTDPPLMSVLVRVVGSIKGAKTVNWLQDIFPEIAEQLSLAPRGFGAGKILRALRNWSLRYSDTNIVLGESMKQKLISFGVREDKIHIITNWADENKIKPVPHNENPLIKEWELENKFIVTYSGNMGRAHSFESILDAAEQLKTYKDIVFLWIGSGFKKKAIEAEAENRKLDNFIFKAYQPKKELSNSLGASHVHLVTLSPNLEGLIVPSKFYGIAAAGRPTLFVGSSSGEIANVIEQGKCGYGFTNAQGKELADKIIELQQNPELLRTCGENARTYFERNNTLEISTNKWRYVLLETLRQKRKFFIPRPASRTSR